MPTIRNTIRKWTGKHNKVLSLTVNDTPTQEIAKITGISVSGVNFIQGTITFKEKLNQINKQATKQILAESKKELTGVHEAREILDREAVKAAKKLKKLMNSGTSKDRLQLDACRDILDRIGLKPIDVVETRERSYAPEEIASAFRTLKEIEKTTLRLSNTGSRFVMSAPQSPDTEKSSVDKKHKED